MTKAQAKNRIRSAGISADNADRIIEAAEKIISLLPGASFESVLSSLLAPAQPPSDNRVDVDVQELRGLRLKLEELERDFTARASSVRRSLAFLAGDEKPRNTVVELRHPITGKKRKV
jgi:hypothetical protein